MCFCFPILSLYLQNSVEVLYIFHYLHCMLVLAGRFFPCSLFLYMGGVEQRGE